MASFVNKLTNSLTNTTGSIIGREQLAKFSNSINQTFNTKSKYRQYLKSGNVVQLVSRNSKRSLQICALPEDVRKLVIVGNGQIGPEFPNSHFVMYINPKSKYITFKNMSNYIGFAGLSFVPAIVNENDLIVRSKKKTVIHLGRAEFRLHEIFGSEEFFALESVHAVGHYLCVTEDGLIQTTKNKTDTNAHFQLHIITEFDQPITSQYAPAQPAGAEYVDPLQEQHNENLEKMHEATQIEIEEPAVPSTDTPPSYTTLYPSLPK